MGNKLKVVAKEKIITKALKAPNKLIGEKEEKLVNLQRVEKLQKILKDV